ncbi:MAG TPA: T9SS type A sorting domain-containing protein [Ignavibacteriaceae bacterium]|nr:T9SS type A sorting domain-containing protein [Ignavibacteriaceae bacterium]
MLPRLKSFLSSLISSLKSNVVFIFCLFYLAGNFSFAQSDNISEQIKRLEDFFDVKVSYVDSNILKLEFPDGEITYRVIGNYKPRNNSYKQTYSPTYDSTIIDLTTIDTTLYFDKYKFWQEVLLGNNPYLIIGDINNNKRPELYGYIRNYTFDNSDVVIKEMNEQGTFDSLFSYDNTIWARSIYDIDKDGNDELHLLRIDYDSSAFNVKQLYFTKPYKDSLPTKLQVNFSPFSEYVTLRDYRYGDFDGDNLTDQFFMAQSLQSMFIYEYNPFSNSFDSVFVFSFESLPDFDFDGTLTGDFDEDGKQELITGGILGAVVVIENTGNNSYMLNWLGSVETVNAYLSVSTNDADKNGKKEIWIGGSWEINGESSTRFTILESDVDNHFIVVGKVDLLGIGGIVYGNLQSVDIDKDGTDEIFMCIGDIIVILKFTGSLNHQKYEVFYVKKNDFTVTNFSYSGAIMYDLDGDNREEFLIDGSVYPDPPLFYTKHTNFIYKPTFLTLVQENEVIDLNNLTLTAYPNPFNSQIEINFSLVKQSNIELSVFNIIGQKVSDLINSELTKAEHKVCWDGKTENGIALPSGIYFIKLTDGAISKTIKAVLLK